MVFTFIDMAAFSSRNLREGMGVIAVKIKKELIRIETVENELFISISDLLKRIERKHPEQLELVKVDENHRTILFISSSYLAANISRILMEDDEVEQSRLDNEKEGTVKVERL
jgi:hypothetical protein